MLTNATAPRCLAALLFLTTAGATLLPGAASLNSEGMPQPFRSRVAAGGFHTCAVRADGKVYCWGRNNYGQVGDNSLTDRLTPVFVPYGVNAVAVAAGNNHSCLLNSAGNVACWGRNQHGQLGDGTNQDRLSPTLVPNLTGVVRLAAGEAHTCAVLVSSEVRCWGRNHLGQLGFNSAAAGSSVPVAVARASGGNLSAIHDLALGINHSCALAVNGALYCWGNNAEGQTAVAAGANPLAAVQVTGLPAAATYLTTGARHTCAVLSTRQVYCWGYNSAGQLGDGSLVSRTSPVLAQTGSSDVVGMSAGLEHTCILRTSGETYCWGANVSGELGDNTFISRTTLGDRVGGGRYMAVASSQNRHSCAVRQFGRIDCWGKNQYGQIGDGSLWDAGTAHLALSGTGNQARMLAVGSDHTCAVRASGAADCWGDNSMGELGDFTNVSRTTPDPNLTTGINETLVIAADDSYACTLTTGLIYCHGFNLYGQLGIGTTTNTNGFSAAVMPAGGPVPDSFEGLGQAEHHACGVQAGGSVKCWGRNLYGQLGDNTVSDRSNPVTANGVAGAVMVTAGRGHSCALIADGTVKCWGLNSSGQLGDGSYTDRLTPVTVTGLTDAVQISAGGLHTCARRVGGRIVCWGNNVEGQLGDGLTTNRNSYTTVMGITTATAVVASAEGNCALLADGTAKCWGDNYYGQVGDGTYTDRLTPVMVADPVTAIGLQGIASLAATSSAVLNISNCAVKSNGKPYCWGSNAAGKLGDGTTTNRNKPTAVLTF